MNWMMITVIGILIIGTLLGWRSGFVKMIFHICSFVAALLLAALLAPALANFLTEQDALMQGIADKVYESLQLEQTQEQIEKLDIPDALKKELAKYNTEENYEKLGVRSPGEYISQSLAIVIVRCASYLVVFFVALIGLFLLCNALDLVSKIGFLDSVNRLAGAALGFCEAVIIIILMSALLTALSNTQIGKEAMEMIADSTFLSYIYEHNPLNGVLLDLSGKFR